MNSSEKIIYDIVSKEGTWKFIEMFDEKGNQAPQAKQYDPPSWIAYPDFERSEKDKVVLLVEVKGYYTYFNNVDKAVAIKYRQYKQYYVVQNKEKAEVRIVFVLDFNGEKRFYWENLTNISKMEFFLDRCRTGNRNSFETFIFWNIEDFRTDIDNLGKI